MRSRRTDLVLSSLRFVSDVTRKDWQWLLNSLVYGHLFPTATEAELASLKQLGKRWKAYEEDGRWTYEEHSFWVSCVTHLSLLVKH